MGGAPRLGPAGSGRLPPAHQRSLRGAADLGFWQGTYRDRADDAITQRNAVTVDVLYGDHEGGQRTISRFALIPTDSGD